MLEDVLRKNVVLYVSANLPYFEIIHNNVHCNIMRSTYMEEKYVEIIPTSKVHKVSASV